MAAEKRYKQFYRKGVAKDFGQEAGVFPFKAPCQDFCG
jgi:hypothetical protein